MLYSFQINFSSLSQGMHAYTHINFTNYYTKRYKIYSTYLNLIVNSIQENFILNIHNIVTKSTYQVKLKNIFKHSSKFLIN